MPMMDCPQCLSAVDARSFARCGACKAPICPDCAQANEGLCEACSLSGVEAMAR